MTGPLASGPAPPSPPEGPCVLCRRLHRMLPLAAHLRCPYCHGSAKAVSAGRHREFCDFEPGRDPVQLGFPEGIARVERG